jgi:ubiquinone/menaquinone biosynthesis C-methylase UbiE
MSIDSVFSGSIPELYDRYMVPLIFEPYAADLARRVAALQPRRVLEIACGTGAVTRQLARATAAEIVATDLNQPMLDRAAATGTARPVEWRQADAMALPFDDGSFDVVVCQFAAMFFPDRVRGFSEARRVLRDGGHFVFSVWDRIEDNELADVVTKALPGADFMARTPHGYHDRELIVRDVTAAGFPPPEIETIAYRSIADSARIVAIAYVQGTPLRNEVADVQQATAIATKAIEERFGSGRVDGKIQAHVVTSSRPQPSRR